MRGGLRDTESDFGTPQIHQAAETGDLAAVRHFMRTDFDAVRREELRPAAAGWRTALHEAAEHGHVEVLSALAAAGADVEKENKDSYRREPRELLGKETAAVPAALSAAPALPRSSAPRG
eukprot:Skav219744  [mRNA]  locus=scaffold301:517964:519245:- [translate_table: standard]